ncbi:MAG: hypothetical protein QOJ84_879 [Bradyrhizobium sp.]|nr:hypothetical protein [Bradyrhizobium sp.]
MKRMQTSSLLRGDIILSTTTERLSKVIRVATRSDISHAMVCVQFSSVIDATGEGVHARNPQRLFFDDSCELLAFRLRGGLSDSQADQVCQFVRQTIGAEYSKMEAVRSVLGGSDQWTRKQFCSRLVAQAYASAGIQLVEDPNYCSPADLARSALLVAIPNVVETVTEVEAARWAAHGDATATMREAINAVLEGARKKDPNIQTLNDIDSHVIKHPEDDAYLANVYIASGYLTVWRINHEKNPWQYEDALLARLPREQCEQYCRGTLKEEEGADHRYVVNRGGYKGANFHYKLKTFGLLFELYDLLASGHRQRIAVARRWLEANGLAAPEADHILTPHSPEWFAALHRWDPVQAAQTKFVVDHEGRTDVCSICGDDPAKDYRLEKPFRAAGGVDTLRLCDDCVVIRKGMGEPYQAI